MGPGVRRDDDDLRGNSVLTADKYTPSLPAT
jgi:hypothetical protein